MPYASLHALYCRLTGFELRWIELVHAYIWFQWSRHFTESDLRLVVRWLKERYRNSPGVLENCLRFRHLIVEIDQFGEYLAVAKSRPRQTDRQSVLAASGRPTAEDQPAKLASPLAAALLAKLRSSLE